MVAALCSLPCGGNIGATRRNVKTWKVKCRVAFTPFCPTTSCDFLPTSLSSRSLEAKRGGRGFHLFLFSYRYYILGARLRMRELYPNGLRINYERYITDAVKEIDARLWNVTRLVVCVCVRKM